MNDLTEAMVRAAKPAAKPYKLTDGAGLHLLVSATGKRLFQYRFRLAGKESTFAIGEYPVVTLREAREKRDQSRKLVSEGVNPSHARVMMREAAARSAENTFRAIAENWIDHNRENWTTYYLRQVTSILAADVYPRLGRRPIKDVSAKVVREILTAVDKRGARTVAILIRQWCSAIFRFAVADGLAAYDPVYALKGVIKRRRPKHKTALTKDGISHLLKKLQNAPGTPEVNIAIQILLLTFVRPGELRGARWSEIDFEEAVWRIPAHRMKMRQAHIVPLSMQALELFERLRVNGIRSFIFPNARDAKRCMSPTTFNRFLERLKLDVDFSAHGFRATASTLLTEQGYLSEAIERQLAHNERNIVRASYNHATHMPLRKKMMQDWADLIDSLRVKAAPKK